MSALRLRSVRFKSGGEIRVLRSHEPDVINSMFRKHAREMADSEPNMAGFIIIAWDRQASATVSVMSGKASPVAGVALPGYAHDAVANFRARVDAERDILGDPKPPSAS